MVRITQCPICGKQKKVYHRGSTKFECCGTRHPIKENLIYSNEIQTQEKTDTTPSFQAEAETQEGVKDFSPETKSESNSPKISENNIQEENSSDTLEIEEYKPKPEEQVFNCPICGNKLEPLKDCLNCGAIITWSEE